MVYDIQQTTIWILENWTKKLIKKVKVSKKCNTCYNPSVINLPTISYQTKKAKLALLSALTCSSTDLAILEFSSLVASQTYSKNVGIGKEMELLRQILDTGWRKKALKFAIWHDLLTEEKHTWNKKMQSLEVQSKFSQVIRLEESTKYWSRILDGLPRGQLPFPLKPQATHTRKCTLYWACAIWRFELMAFAVVYCSLSSTPFYTGLV